MNSAVLIKLANRSRTWHVRFLNRASAYEATGRYGVAILIEDGDCDEAMGARWGEPGRTVRTVKGWRNEEGS